MNGNNLHIIIEPKQAQSAHVTVLFGATCDDQQLCLRTHHVGAVQQEVTNQGVKLTFQIECIFSMEDYLVHVVDKSSDYKLVNAKQPLPSEDSQVQLEDILETLRSLTTVEVLCAKLLRTDSPTNKLNVQQRAV